MAHLHDVIDSDNRFRIDPVTRAIANTSGKVKLVQNDHNAERFTFEISRLVDGHDMSLCDKVEIHYINVSGNKNEQSADVYLINDLTIDEWDEDKVIFSWLISANATKYAGTLNFLIRFVCLDGETIEYAWNTAIFKDITVDNGMDNGEAVIAEYSDVLEAWKEEVLNGTDGVVKEIEKAKAEALNDIAEAKETMLSEIELAAEIVQTTGESETAVMSQKAVTDEITTVDERYIPFKPNLVHGDVADDGNIIDSDTFFRTDYLLSAELNDMKIVMNGDEKIYLAHYDSNKNFLWFRNYTEDAVANFERYSYYTVIVKRPSNNARLYIKNQQTNTDVSTENKKPEVIRGVVTTGGIGGEAWNNQKKRIITAPVYFNKGDVIHITPDGEYQYELSYFLDGAYVSSLPLNATPDIVFAPDNANYFVLDISRIDGEDIADNDVTLKANIVVKKATNYSFVYGNIDDYGRPTSTSRQDRCHSAILMFDEPMYVGLKRSDMDLANNYDNRFYIVIYNEGGTMKKEIDWTRYDTVIPANERFVIIVKHMNNQSVSDIIDRMDEIIEISKTPTYLQIPTYYHENDYLDNKVSFISEKINACSANGDIFVLLSDLHWDRNEMHSPALVKYITDRIPIQRMFNCGDDFDGVSVNVFLPFRKAFTGDYHWCVGNHDIIDTPLNALYATHMENNTKAVFGDTNRLYYYVDNTQKKIRYIVLNSINNNNTYDECKGYDDEQLEWLENIALDVESGWTIFIFTHLVYWYEARSDYVLWLPNDIPNINRFISILDNYNGNGMIGAVFQGDTHTDRVIRTNSGIPIIVTSTDCTTGAQNTDRTIGTINEQLFDVVVVNKTEQKITNIRIGAKARDGVGVSNQGNLVEYRETTFRPE